jgi:hypothetical protein
MPAKRIATVLKFLVPLVIAFFIGRVIYENWQEVSGAAWSFRPLELGVSFLLTGWWFVARPPVWAYILDHFGYKLTFLQSFEVVRKGELSRYVPGTIWQYLSRIYLAGLHGVPAHATIATTLVETVILVLASIVPALWFLPETLPALNRYHRFAMWIIPAAACALLHPKVLNFWAKRLSSRLGQPYEPLRIHWRAMAGIWLFFLLTWLILGTSVALFVRGVIDTPWAALPRLVSDHALAWLVGMLSMIAPAGMGVRDGMFGLLVSRRMPLGTAMTVAVGVRLWLTLAELVWTFGVLLFLKRRQARLEDDSP